MNTIAVSAELHAIEKLREQELEEARSIQSLMLPAEALRSGRVKISHAFQPVAEVGGDFLDYFELSDGGLGLYLGDVSGKGLPAAMYAALAVGTLRGVHKTGLCPSQVLSTLNRRLMIRGTHRRHAAVQYAVFDPNTRVMRIAGGGMPGPFHVSRQGCRALEIQGMPPGLLDCSVSYETSQITLEPNDSVLFFTDGLSDASDADGESFGIERLRALCGAKFRGSLTESLTELFSSVSRFARGQAQHDDMAAAIFHYGDE
jgi:sigma-B regulation protein RsbU (phosphoserine phosphatase)